MIRLLAICLILASVLAFADEAFNELAESTFDSSTTSTEDSANSARVQIAFEVKRDAEGYLAGAEMTRALRLKLEQLQSEHPNLDSDDLVEHALGEADAIIAEERTAE